MNNIQSKKGQVVTGLVFGIATLIIGIIIAFVVVATLMDANLLTEGRPTVTNTAEASFVNTTTDALAGASDVRFVSSSVTVLTVVNATDDLLITSGNYTVSAAGVITNATDYEWPTVEVNYTYTQRTVEEQSTIMLNSNFTAGVDNVSSKIPTILLVAIIVLILGVLALLVGAWQRMRVGGNI